MRANLVGLSWLCDGAGGVPGPRLVRVHAWPGRNLVAWCKVEHGQGPTWAEQSVSELGEVDRARGAERGRRALTGAGTGCFAWGVPGRSSLASSRVEPGWADDNVGWLEKLDRCRIR